VTTARVARAENEDFWFHKKKWEGFKVGRREGVKVGRLKLFVVGRDELRLVRV
jgi:hypothetical protein